VSLGPLQRHGLIYPFIRFEPPSIANGQGVRRVQIPNDPATGKPWSMLASIQPLGAFATLMLPDALRNRATVRVYTQTLLQLDDETKKLYGDRFTWNSYIYEITARDDWSASDMDYYKFLASKIPNQ
jgi:hypothetical protein